ncbi:hypothetical protein ACRAKI_05155 [Saccharothrix isguenensis]
MGRTSDCAPIGNRQFRNRRCRAVSAFPRSPDPHAPDELVTMHSEATLDDVLTDILATRSRTRP